MRDSIYEEEPRAPWWGRLLAFAVGVALAVAVLGACVGLVRLAWWLAFGAWT